MTDMTIAHDTAETRREEVRQWMRAWAAKYDSPDALAEGALEHFGWNTPDKHDSESADVMAQAKEVMALQGTPDWQGAEGGDSEALLRERTNNGKVSEVNSVNPKGAGWGKVAKRG